MSDGPDHHPEITKGECNAHERQSKDKPMTDDLVLCYSEFPIFDKHPEVTKEQCDALGEQITGKPMTAAPWQGMNSYTAFSDNVIVQFRADKMDTKVADLAKEVHGSMAPSTTFLCNMPNTSVSVWQMEKIPGAGYMMIASQSDFTPQKLEQAVMSFARFYAMSWKMSQPKDRESELDAQYRRKLRQLMKTLPHHGALIRHCLRRLDDIKNLPWVLTHADLSAMNIIADQDTGSITGVIDWVDARIEPFGLALWGLNDILGFLGPTSTSAQGWTWRTKDLPHYLRLFDDTFSKEVPNLSSQDREAIEAARMLGILMRHGFDYHEDMRGVLKSNHWELDIYLSYSLFATIDRDQISEEHASYRSSRLLPVMMQFLRTTIAILTGTVRELRQKVYKKFGWAYSLETGGRADI